MVERLGRRAVPVAVSAIYVGLGLAFSFRWNPVVRDVPSLWISPPDLSQTFGAAVALAQLHIHQIYRSTAQFVEYPGIVVLLLPVALLHKSFHTTFVEIINNHHAVATPQGLVSKTSTIWDAQLVAAGPHRSALYAVQPQWFAYLAPYVLLVSCLALFATDALAEHLGVSRGRRVLLCVVEAVALWPAIIIFGHPEDAVAVGLGLYALIAALKGKRRAAGWLFGAAVAFQPLVLVLFPVLLVIVGRDGALGLTLRSLAPVIVLVLPELAVDARWTVHDLVTQPGRPNLGGTHQTPWSELDPKLGGKGARPTRIAALGLAVGVGLWARRWRSRPEMLVWAAALALSLRTFTEAVMTSYYMWPALAVGLVVVARGTVRRFAAGAALVVVVTVVAQWHFEVYLWWAVVAGGVAALLALAAFPEPADDLFAAAGVPAGVGATAPGTRSAPAPAPWVRPARAQAQNRGTKGSTSAKRRKRPPPRSGRR